MCLRTIAGHVIRRQVNLPMRRPLAQIITVQQPQCGEPVLKAITMINARNFSTKKFFPSPFIRLNNEQDAKRYIYFLNKSERQLLHKMLSAEIDKNSVDGKVDQNNLTGAQLKAVYVVNLLPFIGFGILDNLLMIVCGEYIDQTMGVVLGISTLAAAGFGNIISDVAGVGSAHYVEFLVSKLGINPPNLTPAQWSTPKVRWTTNFGRCSGLVLGCLIGMFPLFFYNEKETQERKHKSK